MTQIPEPSSAVYELYGAVMHNAQFWERAIALIWWNETQPGGEPSADIDSRRSKKAIARLEAALLRTTASAARAKVAATLGAAADAEIGELITVRNRLAHRFLIEREAGGGFQPGTYQLLRELGERFFRSTGQLSAVIGSYPAYQGPVPHGWFDAAEDILGRLQSGERLPADMKPR